MHAEILKRNNPKAKQPWRWHFVSKGRITANNETFPSKANALRAVKSVVRSVIRNFDPNVTTIYFHLSADPKREGVFILTWE